jgi:hypothetical protein
MHGIAATRPAPGGRQETPAPAKKEAQAADAANPDALPGIASTLLAGVRVVALDELENYDTESANFCSSRLRKSRSTEPPLGGITFDAQAPAGRPGHRLKRRQQCDRRVQRHPIAARRVLFR